MPYTRRFSCIFVCLTIFLLFMGCVNPTPPPQDQYLHRAWLYTDLKLLDSSEGQSPEQDILAVYLRKHLSSAAGNFIWASDASTATTYEIRLDLLDLSMRNESDIYIALDHTPGGTNALPINTRSDLDWDTLLILPAQGPLTSSKYTGAETRGVSLRLVRDPALDTILIYFAASALETGWVDWQFQIFTTPPGSKLLSDSTSVFSELSPPPPPARVLFAFSNSFPAYSPAQALRRWSGAHTGPFGGTHGLRNLLQAADIHAIPLILLDLKNPLSLSALDYTGGLPLVRSMLARDLLVLPDNLSAMLAAHLTSSNPSAPYRIALDELLAFNLETTLAFELPSSQLLYSPLPSAIPGRYSILFTPSSISQINQTVDLKPAVPLRLGSFKVIQIPGQLPADQATLEGLSLPVRRALVSSVLDAVNSASSQVQPFLILGGDLPLSSWGEPLRARSGFAYIKSRPWIKVLDEHDLLALAAGRDPDNSLVESLSIQDESTSSRIPKLNPLEKAALGASLALSSPISPASPELALLRSNYSPGLNTLLYTSRWETGPQSLASCELDPDQDGGNECVLSSENVLSILELDTGTLTHLFVRSNAAVHQLIGPTSQLIVGLSDPGSWDLALGDRADPSVLPGVTSDLGRVISYSEKPEELSFQFNKGRITYSLRPNGISIELTAVQPLNVTIPVVLDPWERFVLAWGDRYQAENTEGKFSWSLPSAAAVSISSNSQLKATTFNETIDRMGRSENPNYEYPAGHYLPFPLAVVEIGPAESISVQIDLHQ